MDTLKGKQIMGGAYIGSTRKQKKEIADIKKKLEDGER